MSTNFENLKPKIIVIGVGGAGGNAVNNMINSNLEGVEFIIANTDAQALGESSAPQKIQLGLALTQGLGAGSKPDIGGAAAEEAIADIENHIRDANMVFITAGMGGGTGTGAAPVIAKAARALGILTVGVVTKPFFFEGSHRMKTAEAGLEELQQNVDTLIVIPNQNLFRIADTKTTFADAFNMADNVLYAGVRSVTDLMILPGLINLDFADVSTVMSEMGKAMMGAGEAEGENRAIEAAEAAVSNPLLDEVSLKGARRVLINITGGRNMTLMEVDQAANYIRDLVDPNANIIFGSALDDKMQDKIRVSVVATGIENNYPQALKNPVTDVTRIHSALSGNQRELNLNLELATVESSAVISAPLQGSEYAPQAAPIEDLNFMSDMGIQEGALTEEDSALPSSFEATSQPSKKKPSSFFEKLGFKKSAPSSQKFVVHPQKSDSSGGAPLRPKITEGASIEEDMDIPAFLRRKK